MAGRPRAGLGLGVGVVVGFVVSFVVSLLVMLPVARAYDFTLDVRTVGQGYQVRRYAPDGGNELLSRRRITQYLNLNVFGVEPERWRDPDGGGRNTLYVDVSLRFDSDFGGYMLGRPRGTDEIRELQQNQVDILYAYLAGRDVGGRVDFQLGRQIHFDRVDFYSFDGADVSVHLYRPLLVEAFAGTEVRGDLPLSSPLFELDGTSSGSRDPATRPDQSRQLRPMAGAAVALDGWAPLGVRLAYRRLWSATADCLPGEPETGTNAETASLTANAAWGQTLFATAGLRYNLLLGGFDDAQVAVRARLSAGQFLTAEYAYLAPTFDGDSIRNIFSTGAYHDFRAGHDITLGPGVRAHVRAFARLFASTPGDIVNGRDVGAEAPGGRTAGGATAGIEARRRRSLVRADGYVDAGFGGRKAGADISGRYALRPGRWEIEGRLTGFDWLPDLAGQKGGVVFGIQAGSRYELARGVRAHLLGEDNIGTYYRGQYRGLAIIEVDASL